MVTTELQLRVIVRVSTTYILSMLELRLVCYTGTHPRKLDEAIKLGLRFMWVIR